MRLQLPTTGCCCTCGRPHQSPRTAHHCSTVSTQALTRVVYHCLHTTTTNRPPHRHSHRSGLPPLCCLTLNIGHPSKPKEPKDILCKLSQYDYVGSNIIGMNPEKTRAQCCWYKTWSMVIRGVGLGRKPDLQPFLSCLCVSIPLSSSMCARPPSQYKARCSARACHSGH